MNKPKTIDKETMDKIKSVYGQMASNGRYFIDKNGNRLTVDELALEHIRIKNSASHIKAKKLAGLINESK